MKRGTLRAALFVSTCAALAAGCKKDQQSLVVASLKLAPGATAATNLSSLKLSATPGTTVTFEGVTTLSADTAATFGLYLSGDIAGDVSILAVVDAKTGCAGYRGNDVVSIETAGVTRTVDITMRPDPNAGCPADGGTAGSGGGSGGSAGTGGSAGAGGSAGGSGGGAGAGAGGSGGGAAGGTGGTGGSSAGAGGGAGGTGGTAGYPSIASCRTFAHAATNCPNTYVKAVAISPNGQIVASAGDNGIVKIWSFDGRQLTATGRTLSGFTGYGLAFSPDGTRLAHTAGTMVRTYTVSGWAPGPTLLNDGSSNDMVSVAFTPDSQRIVSADAIGAAGGDVFVHRVGGSTIPAMMAHVAKQPASLAVSPAAATDGSVGIAVGTYNGTVALLTLTDASISAPTVLASSAADAAVFTVAFSANGTQFVQGDDYGVLRFWGFPLASTAPIGTDIRFAGGDTVNAIAFSPNGMYMAVGGAFANAQLSIYSTATRAEVERVTPAGNIESLVFAPNGGAIIAGLDACGYVIVCN